MTLSRIQSEFIYSSGTIPQLYTFTVVIDNNGIVAVRNIASPFGLIADSFTQLPQSVLDDINTAVSQAEDLVGLTSPINGQVTFTASVLESVVFTTPLAGTTYRVHVDVPDFVGYRIINRATTGFDIELTASFTGTLGYDVLI